MVMEMSKTYQYRKVMKPLLERKRRARINKCLDDLKDLMVECLQQEGEHVTRLEKADILELTVEHMRKLKQRGALSLQAQSTAHVESFRSGYVHAADQISQVLLQQQQADEIGSKIMKFLSARLIEMQHQLLRTSIVAPVIPPVPAAASLITSNLDYANLSSSSSASGPGSIASSSSFSPSSSFNYKPFTPALAKDSGDLIDVTTVDTCSSSSSSGGDTASVISIDSTCSTESVWRPW